MIVRLLEGVGNSYPGDEGEIAVNLGGLPVRETGGSAAVVGRQAAVAEPDRTHERSHGQVFRGLDRGGNRQEMPWVPLRSGNCCQNSRQWRSRCPPR